MWYSQALYKLQIFIWTVLTGSQRVSSEPASESTELFLQSRHRMSTNSKTTTIVTDTNIINVVLKCKKLNYCSYRKGHVIKSFCDHQYLAKVMLMVVRGLLYLSKLATIRKANGKIRLMPDTTNGSVSFSTTSSVSFVKDASFSYYSLISNIN